MRRSARSTCLASELDASLAYCTREIRDAGYTIVSQNSTRDGGFWAIESTERCTKGVADLALHLTRNVAGFCQVAAKGRNGLVLRTDDDLVEKTIRTRASVMWSMVPAVIAVLILLWILKNTTLL